MASSKACPKCQAPLQIAQPPPEKIHCAGCGTTIRLKTAPAVRSIGEKGRSATNAARQSNFARIAVLLAALGAGVLIAALAVGGAIVGWAVFDRQKHTGSYAVDALPDGMKPLQSERTGKKQQLSPEVKSAVDRGIVFLKKRLQQKKPIHKRIHIDNEEIGAAALVGLTLLECHVPPEDRAVQTVLAKVRGGVAEVKETYVLASCVFFLHRLYEVKQLSKQDQNLLRTLALRLLAGQTESGAWGYKNPVLSREQEEQLVEDLRLGKHQRQKGSWNNSNTQFAMLALWQARKHDIPVQGALLATADHFHRRVLWSGNWCYASWQKNRRLFDSNTCAGLIALALEKAIHEDKEFQKPIDRSAKTVAKTNLLETKKVKRALAHLAKVIGKTRKNPNLKYADEDHGGIFRASAWDDYYFLWSLERMAVIYGLTDIDDKDWYDWGSKVILRNQHEEGYWADRLGPCPGTCFALLFLMRANIVKDLADKLQRLLRQAQVEESPAPPAQKDP